MFLLKGIGIFGLAFFMFYFDYNPRSNPMCKNEDISTLDRWVFISSDHKVYYILFELLQYVPFELVPCIVFQHIIRPKNEIWFYEPGDPLSEQLRKESESLFDSVDNL